MSSKWIFAGSVAVGCVAVIALVNSFNNQSKTDKQLADLQRKLEQATAQQAPVSTAPATPAAQTSPSAPLVVLESKENYLTDYVKKKQAIEKVMQAGWPLINTRKADEAMRAAELFEQAIEKIDEKSPDLYNGLGRALLVAGKPREAIAAWEKGLAIAPKLNDMQSGTGWAYWNLQDYYHAREAWLKAVKTDPGSVDAWSALAWIELALGNYEASREGFAVLVQSNTQNKSWTTGLSMARGRNNNPVQIGMFFPIPEDINVFTTPPKEEANK